MVFACVQFPKSNRKYSDLIIPRLRINISTWSVLFPAVIMLRSLRFWLLAWEAWRKFLSDDDQATVGTWQLAFSSNIVPTALRELWTLNFPSFLRNLFITPLCKCSTSCFSLLKNYCVNIDIWRRTQRSRDKTYDMIRIKIYICSCVGLQRRGPI